MDAEHARTIAERAHGGARDPDGSSVLRHLARVARATPAEAQAIAWLHEVLEHGPVTEHDLLEEGLSSEELRALRLLTSPSWTHSDRVFLVHVELIARATGWSGRVARAVKAADLRDGCLHPRARADGWSPPYEEGLERLRKEAVAERRTAAALHGRSAPVAQPGARWSPRVRPASGSEVTAAAAVGPPGTPDM